MPHRRCNQNSVPTLFSVRAEAAFWGTFVYSPDVGSLCISGYCSAVIPDIFSPFSNLINSKTTRKKP